MGRSQGPMASAGKGGCDPAGSRSGLRCFKRGKSLAQFFQFLVHLCGRTPDKIETHGKKTEEGGLPRG